MLLRGFTDAIMMRSQQAVAAGSAQGLLMNFAVPLQLGVRDVAFPTLNSVSLWLTASGVPGGTDGIGCIHTGPDPGRR
jgi:cytochrome o ubiquinol oxidase subunit I